MAHVILILAFDIAFVVAILALPLPLLSIFFPCCCYCACSYERFIYHYSSYEANKKKIRFGRHCSKSKFAGGCGKFVSAYASFRAHAGEKCGTFYDYDLKLHASPHISDTEHPCILMFMRKCLLSLLVSLSVLRLGSPRVIIVCIMNPALLLWVRRVRRFYLACIGNSLITKSQIICTLIIYNIGPLNLCICQYTHSERGRDGTDKIDLLVNIYAWWVCVSIRSSLPLPLFLSLSLVHSHHFRCNFFCSAKAKNIFHNLCFLYELTLAFRIWFLSHYAYVNRIPWFFAVHKNQIECLKHMPQLILAFSLSCDKFLAVDSPMRPNCMKQQKCMPHINEQATNTRIKNEFAKECRESFGFFVGFFFAACIFPPERAHTHSFQL